MSPIPDSRSVDVILLMSDAPIYQLEFQVTELLKLGWLPSSFGHVIKYRVSQNVHNFVQVFFLENRYMNKLYLVP